MMTPTTDPIVLTQKTRPAPESLDVRRSRMIAINTGFMADITTSGGPSSSVAPAKLPHTKLNWDSENKSAG